ncbi:MAG: hypothetical protein KDJ25_11650 [Rhodoblastus sp.]|nr:hypothetical protein [Rhodoblastus sp.]
MRCAPSLLALCLAVSSAALAQQAGGLSNPLWSTPLESLAAARDRPIFTQSRRPPPLAVAPAKSVFDSAPTPPPFALVGTVVGDDAKFAVLQETGSMKILRLKVGSSAAGWDVADVAPRSVTLKRGAQSVTLELPKPALR